MLKNWVEGLTFSAGVALFNPIYTFTVLPIADNTYDIGSALYSYRQGHFETVVYMTSVTGTLSPSADDTYWLGLSNKGWKGLQMPDTLITDDTGYVLLRNNANDDYVGLKAADAYFDDTVSCADGELVVYSWGVVMADHSFYFAADYGAYIQSIAAGTLDLHATTINLRCGAPGVILWATTTGWGSSYSGTLTGSLGFGATGVLTLPNMTEPVTPPGEEGSIWYLTDSDVLQYRTAAGRETVLSLSGGMLTGTLTLPDDVSLAFGNGDDAIIQWDTAETIDTLKIGVDTGTRCLVITEKGAISQDLSLPQMSNPCLVITQSGSTPSHYHYIRSYMPTADHMMIIVKASTDTLTWLLQSTLDTNDSDFIQRRITDGGAYTWYLDTKPILWSNNATNGGLYLAKKDAEPWGNFPTWTNPTFGMANNDALHTAYLTVDTNSLFCIYSALTTGGTTVYDTDDYFRIGTVSNVPTIYGTGAYVRIGDANTTQHSLDSEDDLYVTGELEVGGASFLDGAVTLGSTLAVTGATTLSSHISVPQGSYIYLDGQGGSEHIYSQTAGKITITASGTSIDDITIAGTLLTTSTAYFSGAVTFETHAYFGYNDRLYFGDSSDWYFYCVTGGATMYLRPSATGKYFEFGESAVGIDVSLWSDTGGDRVEWDASAKTLYFRDSHIQLDTMAYLYFGSSAEFYIYYTGGNDIYFRPAASGRTFNFGENQYGIDVCLWSDTSGDYALWDASDKTLKFVDSYVGLCVTNVAGTIEGQIWYGATENAIKVCTGSVDTVCLLTATQELTNKTLSSTGVITVTDSTDSSSTSTGSIITAGGIGISKKLYVGTDLHVQGASTLNGNVSIPNGTLGVVGAVTCSNTLAVSDATILYGGLTVQGSFSIPDKRIVNAMLGDGSVTEVKLATGAVTTDKIGADAINRDKIADGEIRQAAIGAKQIVNAGLGDGSVTEVKLAGGAVTDAKLATLSSVDINGGAIDGVTIGGAAAPTVTDLGSVATCDINGGTIAAVTLDGTIAMGDIGITMNESLGTDNHFSGLTCDAVAGCTTNFGDILYLSSNDKWLLAQADDEDTHGAMRMLGINVTTAEKYDGNAFVVLLQGFVRDDTEYEYASGGTPLFLSAATAGDITATAPTGTTGFIVRIVGYAHDDADTIYFNPDGAYVELA